MATACGGAALLRAPSKSKALAPAPWLENVDQKRAGPQDVTGERAGVAGSAQRCAQIGPRARPAEVESEAAEDNVVGGARWIVHELGERYWACGGGPWGGLAGWHDEPSAVGRESAKRRCERGPGVVGDPCGLVPAGTAVTSLWP